MEQITTLAEKDGLVVPPFLNKVWSFPSSPSVAHHHPRRNLRHGFKTTALTRKRKSKSPRMITVF
jgi:hypothetical protein